jgi:threonine 3-dehydrogenase
MTVLIESGLDVAGVITHRLGWQDFEEGFAAMASGESGKVILDWKM